MHFSKGKLKNSFIRSNHLLAGELSVWRLSDPPHNGANLDQIVDILEGFSPQENHLQQVKACTVEDVRNLSIPANPGRVFSVIDNCEAYPNGGKHLAHAVIAICEKLNPGSISKDSKLFEEIRNKIHLAFAACTKWERIV